MNILEVQAMVIQMIKDAGYANVKDNLLDGITSSETYPFVLVDLASSENVDLASGAYKRFVHYLNVSVFDKAEDDIRDARETASGELEYILGILNFQLLENKIDYTDTVLNNVKVCGAGCIVEVDAYSDLTYGSTLAIGSNPSGANILIDGKYIGRQTPYFLKKPQSGTYSVEKEEYTFNPVVFVNEGLENQIMFFNNNEEGGSQVERYINHKMSFILNRDNFVEAGDITYTGDLPEIFNEIIDGETVLVKLPIPFSFTVNKSDLKLFVNGEDIGSENIIQIPRSLTGNNVGKTYCPRCIDWVFAFVAAIGAYDSNKTYRVEWIQKELLMQVPEGVPFRYNFGVPTYFTLSDDDIMLPVLPDGYVYEVWRWIRRSSKKEGLREKTNLINHSFEAGQRFRLLARAGEGEHTLSSIISSIYYGVDSFKYQKRFRPIPFAFAIYELETGARTKLGCTYGWYQVAGSYSQRAFRRRKSK